MNSLSHVFPPRFESDVQKLWDVDAGPAELENWSPCRRPGACFQAKNPTEEPSPTQRQSSDCGTGSRVMSGPGVFELVAVLLVLCVRNQRPPLLEWEADVREEFSWLQQFFSCLSFECCLGPSLSPLLPFCFCRAHYSHFHFAPLLSNFNAYQTWATLKSGYQPRWKSLSDLRPPSPLSERRREIMRKRALRLRQRCFFLITAWALSVTPDFEVCHVDRIPVWGRRLLSWPPCTSLFRWNSTIEVSTPGSQRWFHHAAARTLFPHSTGCTLHERVLFQRVRLSPSSNISHRRHHKCT